MSVVLQCCKFSITAIYKQNKKSPLITVGGGRNNPPQSEHRVFSAPGNPVDSRPVCKLEIVCCAPVEKTQSSLSVSVKSWRPDNVCDLLFPNNEFEIFDDFCPFSTKFCIFQKFSGDKFKSQEPHLLDSSPSYMYLSHCKKNSYED